MRAGDFFFFFGPHARWIERARGNINIQISRPDFLSSFFLLISPLLFLATTHASWKDNDSGEIIWISLSCLPVYCWCRPITGCISMHASHRQTNSKMSARHVIRFPFEYYCHIIDGYQNILQIASLGDAQVWSHFHYRFRPRNKKMCVKCPLSMQCDNTTERGRGEKKSNLILHTQKSVRISYTNTVPSACND